MGRWSMNILGNDSACDVLELLLSKCCEGFSQPRLYKLISVRADVQSIPPGSSAAHLKHFSTMCRRTEEQYEKLSSWFRSLRPEDVECRLATLVKTANDPNTALAVKTDKVSGVWIIEKSAGPYQTSGNEIVGNSYMVFDLA